MPASGLRTEVDSEDDLCSRCLFAAVLMTWLTINDIFLSYPVLFSLQCFDAVGWAAGRASGLKKNEWWGAGVVICLERGADLHMSQLMPLPLTVCCFGKIQIGFTSLVPAHPGSPRQRAIKCLCVCVCWRYLHSMQSGVYVMVGRLSICLSPINRRCPVGLLLSALREGDTDWWLQAPALSSRCR